MPIYYRLLIYILFGILPSLVWLFYYLQKDMHPEPKRMIVKIFFYGALITIPIFLLQLGLSYLLDQLKLSGLLDGYPIIADIIKWFVVIAATEEILKYAVVKLSVIKSPELDEPLDIMVYMVVVALGFAAVENVLYLFSPIDNVPLSTVLQTTAIITFIRFIGATFLHTLCSALVGYFMALSSLQTKSHMLTVWGIVFAVLLHGWYDFSIMVLAEPLNMILPLLVIIGLAAFMLYDFDEIKKVKSICNL